MTRDIDATIRLVLAEYGKLAADVGGLAEDGDLFRAGMTSHATVNVMLALEESFDVEFPETMLRPSTFESIAAIREVVTVLLSDQVSA